MIVKKITLVIMIIGVLLLAGCGATAKYGESTHGNITGEMLTISDGVDQAVTGVLWKIKHFDDFGEPTGKIITQWEKYNKEAFGGQMLKVVTSSAFNAAGQMVSAGLIRDGMIGKKACGDGANCGTVISNIPTSTSVSRSKSINDTFSTMGGDWAR